MLEEQWQEVVLSIAITAGWKVHHQHNSRRSVPGWPDVVLVRDGRLIFAELKKESGQVTPAQWEWLRALSECIGVSVYVWRPSDVRLVRATLAA